MSGNPFIGKKEGTNPGNSLTELAGKSELNLFRNSNGQ